MKKDWLTPPQYAKSRGIDPQTARDRIASGELRAVNFAAKGCKRARWRIPPEAIVEFERLREAVPKVEAKRTKRKQVTGKEWF